MRKDFKRFISKIVAGTMLITTVFGNVAIAEASDTPWSVTSTVSAYTDANTFTGGGTATYEAVEGLESVTYKSAEGNKNYLKADCTTAPTATGTIEGKSKYVQANNVNGSINNGIVSDTAGTFVEVVPEKSGTLVMNFACVKNAIKGVWVSRKHKTTGATESLGGYCDNLEKFFGKDSDGNFQTSITEISNVCGDAFSFTKKDVNNGTATIKLDKNYKYYISANGSKISAYDIVSYTVSTEPDPVEPEESVIPAFTYTSGEAITVKAENGKISATGNDIAASVDATTSAAIEIKGSSEFTVESIVTAVLNAITTASGYDAAKVKAEKNGDNVIEFKDVANKNAVIGSITFTKAEQAMLTLPIGLADDGVNAFKAAAGDKYDEKGRMLKSDFDDSANTGFIFPKETLGFGLPNWGGEVRNYGDANTTVQYKAKEAGLLTITVGMGSLQSMTNVSFTLANGDDKVKTEISSGEESYSAEIAVAKGEVVSLSFDRTGDKTIFVKSLDAKVEDKLTVPDFTYTKTDESTSSSAITVKVENGELGIEASGNYSAAGNTITIEVAKDAAAGTARAALARAIGAEAAKAGAKVTISAPDTFGTVTLTIANAKDETKYVEVKIKEHVEGTEIEKMSYSFTDGVSVVIAEDELTLTAGADADVDAETKTITIKKDSEKTVDALIAALKAAEITNGEITDATTDVEGAKAIKFTSASGVDFTITVVKEKADTPVDKKMSASYTGNGYTLTIADDELTVLTGEGAELTNATTGKIEIPADSELTAAALIAAIADVTVTNGTAASTDSTVTFTNGDKVITITITKAENGGNDEDDVTLTDASFAMPLDFVTNFETYKTYLTGKNLLTADSDNKFSTINKNAIDSVNGVTLHKGSMSWHNFGSAYGVGAGTNPDATMSENVDIVSFKADKTGTLTVTVGITESKGSSGDVSTASENKLQLKVDGALAGTAVSPAKGENSVLTVEVTKGQTITLTALKGSTSIYIGKIDSSIEEGGDTPVDDSPAFSVVLGGLTIAVDKDGKATATGTDAVYSFANNTVSIAADAEATVASVITAIETAATTAQGDKVTITKTDSSITVASKANTGKTVTINVVKEKAPDDKPTQSWSTSGTAGTSLKPEAEKVEGQPYIHNDGLSAEYTADGGIKIGKDGDTANGKVYFDFAKPVTKGKLTFSSDLVLNDYYLTNKSAIFEMHGTTAAGGAVDDLGLAVQTNGGKFGIKYTGGSEVASEKAVESGKKVNVKFVVDLDNNRAELYVDGEKVAETSAVTPAAEIKDFLTVDRAAFFVRGSAGASLTAYDTKLVVEDSEVIDPNPPVTTKGGLTVAADKTTDLKVGDKVVVTYTLKDLVGINNYTWYFNYNPEVVKATKFIGPEAGKEDTYVSYTLPGVTARGLLVPVEVANKQIEVKPAADDKDYTGLGADGVKTAAELGRIKLSHLTGQTSGAGAIGVTDKDGILFSVEFEVVGSGNADIKLVPVDGVALFYNEPESGTGATALDSQLENKVTDLSILVSAEVVVEGIPAFNVEVGSGEDKIVLNNTEEGKFTVTGVGALDDSTTPYTLNISKDSAITVKDVLDAMKADATIGSKVTVDETEGTFTVTEGDKSLIVKVVKDEGDKPGPGPSDDVTVTVLGKTLNVKVGEKGLVVTTDNEKANAHSILETVKGAIAPVTVMKADLTKVALDDIQVEGATKKSYDGKGTLVLTIDGEDYTLNLFAYGDVDDNGMVNINDYLAIVNAANDKTGTLFTDKQKKAGDVDVNDLVNINDALAVINAANDKTGSVIFGALQ